MCRHVLVFSAFILLWVGVFVCVCVAGGGVCMCLYVNMAINSIVSLV